jgi:hypothetical protein
VRRWNNRLENPAHFDITRLRIVGEWGQASRYIGARWEDVGFGLLEAGAERQNTLGILGVCRDHELQSLLASTGSKNPDLVMMQRSDDGVILQPADLKWSLDVASYRQISASVLETLVEQVPRLAESLRALLPPELGKLPWRARDGIFVSPKTYLNERFLTSTENKKQEYPIEPSEVLLIAVEPYGFYEPLPGWLTAGELARIDGSARGLGQIDTADRYYHLGAGVAGALVALERSIFDEEEPVKPAEEVDRLRDFLKTISPATTAMLIDRLGVQMRHRRDLIRQLRDLIRSQLSFQDFAAGLVKAGLASEGDSDAMLRRHFGEPYRSLIESEEAEIRKAGRDILVTGASDAQALEQLGRRREVYARRLRARMQTAIQEMRECQNAATTILSPGEGK